MLKKTFVLFFLLLLIGYSQDSLHFRWEESVYFGGAGGRTVTDGNTLIHHSGNLREYPIIANENYRAFSAMEIFNNSDDWWNVKPVRLQNRSILNLEYYEGKVYIFGGQKSITNQSEEMEIYDIGSNSVSFGSPLPTPRKSAGSAIWNGKIYIVGGYIGNSQYTNSLEIYDIASDSWSEGANLPWVGGETEMAAYNGKLYVMGGYNGETSDRIFEYDIASDSWSELGQMPHPTSSHKLGVYNGTIICISDYEVLNRIMTYNIASGEWKEYNSNIFPRRHASIAIIGDRLYYVGGVSSHDGTYQSYRMVQSLDLNTLITSVESNPEKIITNFRLEQNYPNPFNPTSTIQFTLNKSVQTKLTIYNSIGELVETLFNKKLQAGNHTVEWNAKNYASGVYVYRLSTPNFSESKKMSLLK